MKILVDADACPVKDIIERVARELEIPVLMFIDTSHILDSDYSEIITVSQGADAVDFALINKSNKGDVIVSQDYGVAALALGKGAYAIHHSGQVYNDDNIGSMLTERHISKVNRMAGKKSFRKNKKKNKTDKNVFYNSFYGLCEKAIKEGEEKNHDTII